MGLEARRILALIGDQRVTIAAFLGLLLYGAVLLVGRRSRSGRVRAILIIGGAALWLLATATVFITGDLARWSSFAVFLFAIGVEGGTSIRPAHKPQRSGVPQPDSTTREVGMPGNSAVQGCADSIDANPGAVAAILAQP
ncbi:hypothetical protein DMC47_39300 [Nostoc sp. 3335mG]|nr:hypothetical protein DMC47_39300 [Nostoc sp. 3335mG]